MKSIEDNWTRIWAANRWWIAIFLLALTVRIVYAFWAARVDPFLRDNPLHGDAASYDRIVRSLLAGGGFAERPGSPTAFWPPLYPLLLAAWYRVCGYSLLAARLLQAVLGAVAVAVTSLAARSVFGRRVAILTGLGMACYPHLVYFGAWLIPEALYLALLALTVCVAVRLQSLPRRMGFAALGLLLGWATLAKPATLMLLPLVVWWLWIAPPPRPTRARLVQCLWLLALAVVVIAPWTVRNYQVFQTFVPVSTNGGYTFYGANNADAFGGHREAFPPPLPAFAEPQAEQEYYRRGMEWIVGHPGDFARLALRKLVRLFSPLSVASYEQDYPLPLAGLVRGIYTAFLILALVGALWSLPRWREVAIFYALIVRVLLGTVIFYGDARYTMPMVPSLVVFASVALVLVYDRLRARRAPLAAEAMRTRGGHH